MTRQYTKDQDSRIAKRAEELRKLNKQRWGFRLYDELGGEFFLSPDTIKKALHRHKLEQARDK